MGCGIPDMRKLQVHSTFNSPQNQFANEFADFDSCRNTKAAYRHSAERGY